jgi:hypothetical protein
VLALVLALVLAQPWERALVLGLAQPWERALVLGLALVLAQVYLHLCIASRRQPMCRYLCKPLAGYL